LLDAAYLCGEFLERHRILDQRGAEDAMLRMTTNPPRKQGLFIQDVTRMIEEYAMEKNSLPNPTELCEWLGAKRPPNDGDPLEVGHPHWTDPMKKVSWRGLQNLVKQAKRKIKR